MYVIIDGHTIDGLHMNATDGRYYATDRTGDKPKRIWFGNNEQIALRKFREWQKTQPPKPMTDAFARVSQEEYWRFLFERVKNEPEAWTQLVSIVGSVCKHDDDKSAKIVEAVAPLRDVDELSAGLLSDDPRPHYDRAKIDRILAKLTY